MTAQTQTAKHTPWAYGPPKRFGFNIKDSTGRLVAQVYFGSCEMELAPKGRDVLAKDDLPDFDCTAEYARLIAAAPELLAALEECERIYGMDWDTGTYAARKVGNLVRSAIAKATNQE